MEAKFKEVCAAAAPVLSLALALSALGMQFYLITVVEHTNRFWVQLGLMAVLTTFLWIGICEVNHDTWQTFSVRKLRSVVFFKKSQNQNCTTCAWFLFVVAVTLLAVAVELCQARAVTLFGEEAFLAEDSDD